MTDTITPNAKLAVIEPTRRNWASAMNRNMELLDAIIGAYFVVGSLQGVWENSTVYGVGDSIVDPATSAVWQCQVAHTSSSIPTTFAEDRAAYSTYWTIFSSPARARGAWTAFTNYAINDFVVSGSQYAVCIETHASGASFAGDSSKWSILVDLSTAGSLVLPVLSGVPDANKTVTTNAAGTAYIVRTIADTLTMLGATSVGNAMFIAASEAAGRAAINAQIAGSYQPLDGDLTSIAANGITTYGLTLLLLADAAAARSSITPLTTNYDIWSRIGGVDARIALSGLIDGSIAGSTQGDILIRNTSIWTRLPAGADTYKALFTGGSGADPTFSGTWKVLGEANPSAASSVDFTGIPSTVKHLMLMWELVPGTNAVGLDIRTYGADGVLDTGAGDYLYLLIAMNTAGASGIGANGSTDRIKLHSTTGVSNNSSYSSHGFATLKNIQVARYTVMDFHTNALSSDGNYWRFDGAGVRNEADRITGISIFPTSGTITGRAVLLAMSD